MWSFIVCKGLRGHRFDGYFDEFGVVESCSCCFVAQVSERTELPAGDCHGGVGRRVVSPSVRLLRLLKGFLLCFGFTHVELKAVRAAFPLYHLPPWSTPSNTYGLSGCMGARHLAACAMIGRIFPSFVCFSLFCSFGTHVHAFEIH